VCCGCAMLFHQFFTLVHTPPDVGNLLPTSPLGVLGISEDTSVDALIFPGCCLAGHVICYAMLSSHSNGPVDISRKWMNVLCF